MAGCGKAARWLFLRTVVSEKEIVEFLGVCQSEANGMFSVCLLAVCWGLCLSLCFGEVVGMSAHL